MTLAQMVEQRTAAYSCRGEITFQVAGVVAVMQRLHDRYATVASARTDHTDGLSVVSRPALQCPRLQYRVVAALERGDACRFSPGRPMNCAI